eukprot:COSAG01_NODE_52732_length_344_cov_1.616327_2_plen_43_part_01
MYTYLHHANTDPQRVKRVHLDSYTIIHYSTYIHTPVVMIELVD